MITCLSSFLTHHVAMKNVCPWGVRPPSPTPMENRCPTLTACGPGSGPDSHLMEEARVPLLHQTVPISALMPPALGALEQGPSL